MQTGIRLAHSALLLFSCAFLNTELTVDTTIWCGSIKFPTESKVAPPMRIYYKGNKIPCSVDELARTISFTISEYKTKHVLFYIIIVDRLDFVSQSNTVHYLKVPEDRPYKLYEVEFISSEDYEPNAHENNIEKKGSWNITQKRLDDDLRIPDTAIIVCYHAHLVKKLEGGNGIELPNIIIDQDVVAKLTDEELNDASVQFLLSSLHCDSIHTFPETQIKVDIPHKTIISLTA